MKIPVKLQSACSSGLEYMLKSKSTEKAWNECVNPQWMFWALRHIGYDDRKTLTLLACKIACDTPLSDGRHTYELMTDKRSRDAIEAAILYAHRKITLDDLRVFKNVAANAAYAAAAVAAATDAAVADVADAADAADAAAAARKVQCQYIREFIPFSAIKELI
jgi:hypothetical protein